MPTVRDTAELLALQRKIEGLSLADQFTLVAGLVQHGKYDLAETIGGTAVDALRMMRLRPIGTNRAVTHPTTCVKQQHALGGAYLHSAVDDSPYDVDGCRYCGRCHQAL